MAVPSHPSQLAILHEGVECIQWPAFVNKVMHLRDPLQPGIFLASLGTNIFSGMTLHHEVVEINVKSPRLMKKHTTATQYTLSFLLCF